MNTGYIAYIGFACGLFIQGATQQAHAAQVTFTVIPNPVQYDTATIVEVHIDPEGESLNAIEGVIGILGSGAEHVSSIVVETGGSGFSLWPVTPTYAERVIRFMGGSPSAITNAELLFRMRIFSEKSAYISLSWLGGSAYLSDGEGTTEGISSRSLSIALTQSEPNQINASSRDSSPPYFETLEVSRDLDVYDGKYFLSFHANDYISGIARYEVIENQITTKTINGVYLMQDQDRKSKIVVVAYDKAGNSTSIKVPTKYEWFLRALLACIFLAVILGALFYRKIGFRR